MSTQKNKNQLPPTWKWWCYGCKNLKYHYDRSDDSPCKECVGTYKKPYYNWYMQRTYPGWKEPE
jgi:hypothetical protein